MSEQRTTRKQPSKGVKKVRPDLKEPTGISEVFILMTIGDKIRDFGIAGVKLEIPIGDESKIEKLTDALILLGECGITFDHGIDVEKDIMEWELDWSLKGAKVIIKFENGIHIEEEKLHPRFVQTLNPRTKRYVKIDGWTGKLMAHKKSEGPYKNIPIDEGGDKD